MDGPLFLCWRCGRYERCDKAEEMAANCKEPICGMRTPAPKEWFNADKPTGRD
jgi:hypothetical protein